MIPFDMMKNSLLSVVPGGFFAYRTDYKEEEIVYSNESLWHIFDCETEEEFMELTGGTFAGMVYPDDYARVEKSIQGQIDRNHEKLDQVSYRIKTKLGIVKYVNDYGRYCEDKNLGPLFFVFIAEAHITHDHLTGLPNRATFLATAENLERDFIAEGKTPAVIAFDLKGMKIFNAKYGLEEGDRILRVFASILTKHFGSECCSRFGEDHFYAFATEENLDSTLNQIIDEMRVANNGRTMPVKIGLSSYQREVSLTTACDRARIACEVQKNSYDSSIGNYTPKLSETYLQKEYILSHLDEAMENGWIKVFVQPIVRTLSKRVCSAEALVRWIDPVRGFISPGDFIPILEENGLSYKMDMFVVQTVAAKIGTLIKENKPVIPVSVNISRADFDYCDPVSVVAKALDVNEVPHSLIAVEITESAFMVDTGFLTEVIDRFHEIGVEVWMDDFGSGYSSLNIVKDFNFDEIKIDMLFMKRFDEKSKTIVTRVVQMAKELGMHTLAEGVETEEQVDFLYQIGCERIQGYYYFKPSSYDEALEVMRERGMRPETKDENVVQAKIGLVNLLSHEAIALMGFDGATFTPFFENEKYKEIISESRISVRDVVAKNMNQNNSILRDRFLALANQAAHTKQTETTSFVLRNHYYVFSFREIATGELGQVLLVSVNNTLDEKLAYVQKMDDILRNLVSLYESVYLVDLIQNTREIIVSNLPNEQVGARCLDIHDFYQKYPPREIHPDDMSRWKVFTSRAGIIEGFAKAKNGYFEDVFRVKNADGTYSWKNFVIVALPETDNQRFLVCVIPSVIETYKNRFDELFEIVTE